jgi:hypothetical protein
LEFAQGTDRVTTSGSLFARTTDTARVQDTTAGRVLVNTVISETVRASSTFSSLPTYRTNILESVTAADIAAGKVNFAARIIELAQGSVEIPTNADLHIGFQDSAAAFDRYNNNVHVFAYTVDVAQASTQDILARFLWELIDDTQNANWQNITNTQNPGWVLVSSTQGASWQLLDTTQGSGWQVIDNNQDPSWININNI